MSKRNKLITTVHVVFRKDGLRPFAMFFSDAHAKAYVEHHMDGKQTGISKRQIAWRWYEKANPTP